MWKWLVHSVERIHHLEFPVSGFSWGADYVGEGAAAEDKAVVTAFVDGALADSDTFFAAQGIPAVEMRGGDVSFSSPLIYPGRTSPNAIARAKMFSSPRSKRAVIVIPHWGARPKSYIALCKALARFGITAVRLTMPYHEERGGVDPNDFVSANVARTIQAMRQAVVEVRSLAAWLMSQGYVSVGLFGSSIGSCIAHIADAHDASIRSVFAMHMSSSFGDVVWRGASTKHVQQGLDGHVGLPELRKFWSPISPISYIRRFAGTDPAHYFVVGEHDLTFPYDLTENVFNEYDRYHIPFTREVLPVGHFTPRYGPFKYYTFARIYQHFKNTL